MKKRLAAIFLTVLLSILTVLPAVAEGTGKTPETQTIPTQRLLPRVYDEAQLLSGQEEEDLLSKVDEISERQQCDVAVITADSLYGWPATDYADDFYDYNGYGMGAEANGILLLIGMEDRDWAISTHGYGITAFTDAGQTYMVDEFRPYLSDGDYAGAFNTFADLCDDFITQAKTGEPYDVDNMPKGSVPVFMLFVDLAIGFVLALIMAAIKKGKLKTVRPQNAAEDYAGPGSLVFDLKKDVFVRKFVTARVIERESPGDMGGSSTHTGSSGRNHGGSSGNF